MTPKIEKKNYTKMSFLQHPICTLKVQGLKSNLIYIGLKILS